MRLLVLPAVLIMQIASPAFSCTTGVVSGSVTADGRPLLWKNRDFSVTENEVVYINDGRYKVMAVANAGARKAIWMGMNDAGLCIENSVTKDLGIKEKTSGPGNGGFMLLALQTCRTVGDVKALLEKTDKTGRTTVANFGVIDAEGGAALFEAAPKSHLMFDANNPKDAPNGYIVRSNFSTTGQKVTEYPLDEKIAGLYSGQRYLRARELFSNGSKSKLNVQYLLQNCTRDLADEDGTPFPGSVNGPVGEMPEFICTKSTISRSTTVSYAVFQGVKKGENPLLTTMWVGLGDPKFSVAVPCWVATEKVASELQGAKGGPLCQAAIALRGEFYKTEGEGVTTSGLQEVWQHVWPTEERQLNVVEQKLEQWRKRGIDVRSMSAIHQNAAEQGLAALQDQLKQRQQSKAGVGAQQQ